MGSRGKLSGGGESRARNNTHKRKRKAERPTRCVALQLTHPRPRGTRRRGRTCVVRAHQAGAKTIKVWRCCRTNRPGPSNAVPQISSTIHKRAAASNAAAATAAIAIPIHHRQPARPRGTRRRGRTCVVSQSVSQSVSQPAGRRRGASPPRFQP